MSETIHSVSVSGKLVLNDTGMVESFVKIRQANLSDLRSMETCAREFYAASRASGVFSMEKFIALWTVLLTNGNGAIFFSENDGKISGGLGAIVHPEIYEEGGEIVAEEMFWYVSPEFRRGLTGPCLVSAFERWGKQKGAVSVQMVHLAHSMPAKLQRFYASRGYELIETRHSKRLAA